MNEIQKVEAELLQTFVDICNKLGLKYYLVCGSVLGAVKYQGFIPWDDDIDVGMPRKDYEKFLEKAQAMLPSHLFLQNYKTDKAFPHIYTKFRNSNTTLIETNMAHLPMNHGISIDIFPLDGYPKDPKVGEKMTRKKEIYNRLRYCALNNKGNWKVTVRSTVLRVLGYHKRTQKTIEKIHKLISQYPTDGSEIWCNHGNWQGEKEYAPRWHYGEGIKAVFEGVEVIIPEKYDDYLTQKYGYWRNDPPKDKMKSHHNYTVCDANKPYTEYLK